MSQHTLAILVEAIGAGKANKQLKGLDRTLSNIGGHAGKGLRTAGRNLAHIGAVGAGIAAGLGVLAIKQGIDSLASLESATMSVDGAIKQLGLTGQITSQQVAGWANQIEAATGAAFDDKDITRASATLLRFGKVTPKNLRAAMVVMTDLAAKTGSVDSASTLLAKALADPTKASGKLARAGVILTKEDEKRLKQLVKAHRLGEAQALLLERITKTTKGAALASQGPYERALSTLNDGWEDATRLIAQGFLPVIEKAAKWLQTALADPTVQANIAAFGQNLAGAFDAALNFAQKIPWGAVWGGLQKAADFAGTLFDAFRSMPPEVQSTILALAGLDAISGGAIHNIVGEIGKGLIKGVLGMTAGVVNIRAGVVNGGGGGVPGAAGQAAGAAGELAPMGLAALGATAFAGAVAAEVGNALSHGLEDVVSGALDGIQVNGRSLGDISREAADRSRMQTPFGIVENLNNIPAALGRMGDAVGQLDTFLNRPHPDFLGDLGQLLAAQYHPDQKPATAEEIAASIGTYRAGERDAWTETTGAVKDVKAEQTRAADSMGHAIDDGATRNERATQTGALTVSGAMSLAATRITSAINALNLVPMVTVTVTGDSVGKVLTQKQRSSGGTSRNPGKRGNIPT